MLPLCLLKPRRLYHPGLTKSYSILFAKASDAVFCQQARMLFCEKKISSASMSLLYKRPDFSLQNNTTPCRQDRSRLFYRHTRSNAAVSTESTAREQIKRSYAHHGGQMSFSMIMQNDQMINIPSCFAGLEKDQRTCANHPFFPIITSTRWLACPVPGHADSSP